MAFQNYCKRTGYHLGNLYQFSGRKNWQTAFLVPPFLQKELGKKQIVWSTGTSDKEEAEKILLTLREKAWSMFNNTESAKALKTQEEKEIESLKRENKAQAEQIKSLTERLENAKALLT